MRPTKYAAWPIQKSQRGESHPVSRVCPCSAEKWARIYAVTTKEEKQKHDVVIQDIVKSPKRRAGNGDRKGRGSCDEMKMQMRVAGQCL